jgi:hypothetical protein
MRIHISLFCLLLATTVSAQIYRSVDKDGNVVFTDQPSPEAELIQIDKLQTISPPAPTADFDYEKKRQKPEAKYTKVSVVSPVNDAAIRENSGKVTVSVSTMPALAAGDTLVVYLDGKENPLSGGTSKTFSNLDRGTHQLRAAVKNSEGRIVLSSQSVTFHLLRQSVNRPNRAN